MENKTNIYKILCIILLIILIAVLSVWGYTTLVEKSALDKYHKLQQSVNISSGMDSADSSADEQYAREEDTEETTANSTDISDIKELPDIPQKNINWDELKSINEDIYAWIYVPGTDIDYPVLQHPTDDSYYLSHNLDGSKGHPGCIYTEKANSRDFTDYNTIIYGHNMRSGAMFRTLHNFEDSTVFDTDKYVYIYTQDKVFIYEIFAAYTSDASHILYKYTFDSAEHMQSYLDDALKQAVNNGYVRKDVNVTGESAIVTLSTCTSDSSERYLVQAVLINE